MRSVAVVLLFLSITVAIPAQESTSESPELVDLSLHNLTQAAGLIFSGTVLAVEQLESSENTHSLQVTRITFQVKTAIRGTETGRVIQINEWQGLWSAGERYRKGEQVFLFLYPPSNLGLTSPVAGKMGRFAIDGKGSVHILKPGISETTVHVRDFAAAVRHISEN